tara:strand:+ start:4242 stop:6224 length:1983 start_codon:yes stop_codon:yes gene_type:complete
MSKKNTVYLLIGLTFVLILLFYFFARGVNVSVLPEEISSEAVLDIDNGLGFKFGRRLIFFPGKKTISIKAPGYYEKIITFDLKDSSNVIEATLEKLPGRVFFEFLPDVEAQIYIDEKEFKTNKEGMIELSAGSHSIVIKHPLYVEYVDIIEVEGLGKEQYVQIRLKPGWSNLSFSSFPDNAEVFVDGKKIGSTPLTEKVVAGSHEVAYKYPGYKDLKKFEKVEIGKDRKLAKAILELLPGILSFKTDPQGASIIIDQKFMGLSPKEVNVAAERKHDISISKDGFSSFSTSINVSSKETKILNIKLQPIFGVVEISSQPIASIFLNGNFLSETPFKGELPVLEHKLEISKKGYRTYKTYIKPNQDLPSKVSTQLLTEEQARYAESKKSYTTSGLFDMKLFKPSSVLMGAKRSEQGQRANEVIRNVKLTKPFFLGEKEITNAQYMKFRQTNSNGVQLIENQEPITNLSWNDAALYCNWLSKNEGFPVFYQHKGNRITGVNYQSNGYRLPTEAEWAWIARSVNAKGKKQSKFPWGNKNVVKNSSGNFADESSKSLVSNYIPNYDDGYPGLASVGSFEPNDKGIYDLGGNVSEWTNDFYAIIFKNQQVEIDPTGPLFGVGHVVRGSSWKTYSLSKLRYSYRDSLIEPNEETGFRVARWLVGKDE